MSTNDEILQVATHDLIRQLNTLSDTMHGTDRQRVVADIAVCALLALRDTVNRPDHPEIYAFRITRIQELCSSLPPPPK